MPIQPQKEESPIFVTEFGIMVFLQPNNNVFDDVPTTRKLFINGVLYIEHNGLLFNAQGARVK